jgi:hypothetical protein
MTATPATNGRQQQPTTAHNARKSHANLGYVRPKKQTVEDQRLGATGMNNLLMFRTRMDNEQ